MLFCCIVVSLGYILNRTTRRQNNKTTKYILQEWAGKTLSHEGADCQTIGVEAETADYSLARRGYIAVMTELLSCVYITNMHFDYGATEAAYAVVEGDAGVGVGTGIEHYAIVCEAYFLHFVYQFALDIALIIFQFDVRKALFELWEV